MPSWSTAKNKITKDFLWKNFQQSIFFINSVSAPCLRAGIIPSLHCYKNKVTVEIPTDDPEIKDSAIRLVTAEIDKIFETNT
ncbi:MAG: 4a-hydroxytetrahydrobiopterin dehydratase [Patescibacteria group bacterium]